VTPADFVAPRLRTQEEIADILVSQGLYRDEQGRVRFPNLTFSGIEWAFDPSLTSPLEALTSCLMRIELCAMSTTFSVDECVAATPRCITETPWLNDPGGNDCCPLACLQDYFDRREAGDGEAVALNHFRTSDCFPGLEEYLTGVSP
jgi:hypothetical protein